MSDPSEAPVPDDAFLPYARGDTAPRYRLGLGLAGFFLVAGLFLETWVPPLCLAAPILVWLALYHAKVARHRRVCALVYRAGAVLPATVVRKRVEAGMLHPQVTLAYTLANRPREAEQPVALAVSARCRPGATIDILVHPDHPRAWLPAALRTSSPDAQGHP